MIRTKNINAGFVGEVCGYNGDIRELIKCMNTENITPTSEINMMESHMTEKIDGDTFFIFSNNERTKIYKLLPLVKNDGVFRWERAKWMKEKGQNVLFCKIEKGMFRFCCTYYLDDGTGRVNVYMNTVTGHGRKSGDIDGFWLDKDIAADNDAFIDSINEWISMFVNKVMYEYDIPKGSNYKGE